MNFEELKMKNRMTVKELIKQLEKYDGESLIEIYNVNYTDCRFDQYFGIDRLYSEKRNIDKAVVIEIKNTGE